MARTLSIAVFSGLIALFPAFFVALVLPELPATRQILAERVCGPGGELNQRVTVTNMTSRRVTHHCRDVNSGEFSESVSLALFMQGMRLALPPTFGVIGVLWWSTVLVRRGRAERRREEVSRSSIAGGGAGPTVLGTARVAPTSGSVRSDTPTHVALSRGDLGPETAAIVERMVSGGEPSTQDVSELLKALGQEGTVTSIDVTRNDRTVDLGGVLGDASGSLDRATGARGGRAIGGAHRADVEASLRELQRLFQRGLITQEEHELRRSAVLERAFG